MPSPESLYLSKLEGFLQTLPLELLNKDIPLPIIDKNLTLSLRDICASAYYGADFFKPDANKFKSAIKKKITTQLLNYELEEAKFELLSYTNLFNLKVNLDNKTSSFEMLKSIIGTDRFNGFSERHKQYLQLKVLIKKGSLSRLNFAVKDYNELIRDFNLSGSEKLDELYREFDTTAKFMGFNSFKELAFSKMYLNRIVRSKNIKLLPSELKLLEKQSAFIIDLYIQIKLATFPNIHICIYGEGIQLMYKTNNIVEIFAPIYTQYVEGEQNLPPIKFSSKEEVSNEKLALIDVAKNVFGSSVDIDMTKFDEAFNAAAYLEGQYV